MWSLKGGTLSPAGWLGRWGLSAVHELEIQHYVSPHGAVQCGKQQCGKHNVLTHKGMPCGVGASSS
jgi:hypothetical protein